MSKSIDASSIIASNKIRRFRDKMEAFKTAQSLEPAAEREKVSGFVLLVGEGPEVILAGEDREAAIEKAVEILNQNDTVVFLSKLLSKFGKTLVTKDQLILTRKLE